MDNNLDALLEDALNDLLEDNELGEEAPAAIQEGPKATDKGQNKHGEGSSGNSRSGLGEVNEEEMNKFFENMTAQLKDIKIDPEEARAKINESVPQIFDLMQNLLSKELLYPALKDLSPKFEEWLTKNGPNLNKPDRKRYRQQKKIINEIIYIFDDETLDDRERFERNLDLMEKMQSLGSPPEELTVPQGMDKCSIM